MDTRASILKVSPDLARESLIAISQLNPNKNLLASELLLNDPNNVNGAAFEENDIAGNYRSKLISISCSPSPDVKPVPGSPCPVGK